MMQAAPTMSRSLSMVTALLLASACGTAPPLSPPDPPSASAAPGASAAAPADLAPVVLPLVQDRPAPPAFPAERKDRLMGGLDEVAALVARRFEKLDVPALSAGVVIDGELVWSHGYGVRALGTKDPVDADTVFRIGSITKTITAMAAQKLVERGKLDLDAPAERYLPELGAVAYPTRDSAPITTRHLLTHSSGLPRLAPISYTDPDKVTSERELLASLAGLPLERAPDVESVYSNLGFGLAGMLVARVSGVPYRDFVQAEIFEPLGMKSATWDESSVPAGRMAIGYRDVAGKPEPARHWVLGPIEPAGGVYASVRDLSRLAAAQLDAWPPRDAPETGPLRRSSIREMHQASRAGGLAASVRHDDDDIEPAGTLAVSSRAVGLGWQILETCELEHVVWHNGGTEAYASALYTMPQHGVAVVVLSSGKANLDRVALDILLTLRKTGGLLLRRAQPTERLREAMTKLAGLLEHWDEADYDALFAESFKKSVPAEAFAKSNERMNERHGACRFGRVLSVEGPLRGEAELACDRGRLVIEVSLDRETSTVIGASARSTGFDAPDATRRAAGRLVDAMPAFDKASCRRLFTDKFDCSDLERLFDATRTQLGACKIGVSRDSDGQRRATFELSCERGSRNLTIGVGPGAIGPIEYMVLEPSDPAASSERCRP
jgi:CubicO group peptidase (beta-lactamase class C family)